MTIGQTAPPTANCTNNADQLQATVTSGNAYVVPATVPNWTITSWSTQTGAGAGQMLAMKAYRPLGGATYMVVGHDGPHPLAENTLNTFPASVPVKAGDVLGLSTPPAPVNPGCVFAVPGETYLFRSGNLADGAQGDFTPFDRRLDVSAVVTPTNSFGLGKVKRNENKGTATITLEDVPNPGELVLSGKGVKRASAAGGAVIAKTVTAPGDVKLKIRAKGKKKNLLNEVGKVKVKPKITFTPTGGDPNTRSRKLKLTKR